MRSLELEENNVSSVEYVFRNNCNYYIITLVSRGNFCPSCSTFIKKIHGYKDRNINHSLLLKENLTVIYHQRRYKCPKCGKTFIESNPFVSDHPGSSNTTISKVLLLLKDYNHTFSSVARLTGISVTQVIEIFDEHVQIQRKPFQEVICIDEFYLSKNAKHKYACLLVGFKNGLVLDVLESRKKSHLRSYFREIDKNEREKVRFISMDMYENYRAIAHIYFPNALCCADSFHVMKNINDSLNRIRKKVMNRYKNDKSSDEYYLLKHKKSLLFMDSLKINDSHYRYNHHFRYKLSDGALLERILDIDSELRHAYELKELYSVFNSSSADMDRISAELDALISAYLISGISEFVEIGNTMSNWREEIINSFHTYEGRRINNGPIEGRNKYIKIITGLANGYRNFKRLRNRILYVFNRHENASKDSLDTRPIKLPGKERGKYQKRKNKKNM